MNPLASRRSFLIAPAIVLASAAVLLLFWSALPPERVVALVDDGGFSFLEVMTLPLFALIVPLVWLCPPASGPARRQAFWSSVWSLLAVMAVVRQTDLHKILFARIWPAVAAGFKGTVFKMRFLRADDVPFAPKVFVFVFFVLFFVAVVVPLVRYLVPLFKGFFRFEPVAWTMAAFGACSTGVLVVDRLPSKLRHAGFALSDGALALMKTFEEGGEAVMALLALLAVLQSYLWYNCRNENN